MWVSVQDEKSGQTYLYNPATKATKWLWSKEVDKKSGKVCYRNGLTGEVRWGDPSKAAHNGKLGKSREDSLRKKYKLDGSVQLYVAEDGQIYAFDSKSRKSTWLRERVEESTPARGRMTPENAATALQMSARSFLTKKRLSDLGASLHRLEQYREDYKKVPPVDRDTSTEDVASRKQKLIGIGELITQELLKVDGVPAGSNEIIRRRRKRVVAGLLAAADEVDAMKQAITVQMNSNE